MRRLLFGRLGTALVAGLTLVLLSPQGLAQEPEKVSFETFDKAMLRGSWYPAKDGKKPTPVLLVHKLGGDRQTPGFDVLAKALQAKGFAVLTFDFRGHGDSLNVKPEFWRLNARNLNQIKGANYTREKIDYRDFSANYYTNLVNDIAAAKYFLEYKNNAGDCNVRDLIVIGAEDGGTLAALWAATEWGRRRKVFVNNYWALDEAEGKDLAGMVYLSLQPALGSEKMPVHKFSSMASWFRDPPIRDKTGLLFLYGAEDAACAKFTKSTFDSLRVEKYPGKSLFALDVKETKLAGAELIHKGLPTEDLIVRFLSEKLRPAAVWDTRDLKMNILLPVQSNLLQ